MKLNRLMYTNIFVLLILSSCSNQPSYLVSVHNIGEHKEKEYEEFYVTTKKLLLEANGAYLDKPIIIDEELPNEAMPSISSKFQGDRILIAEFPTKKDLNIYLNNQSVKKSMDKLSIVANKESVFTASEFNPMGMLTTPPKLGSVPYRDDPAFIMINSFSFKSMLNPLNPIRIMSYMNTNGPRIEAAGVKVLMPFKKLKDIRGSAEFEALFLTEWPSKKEFYRFHKDKTFIDLSKKTRNKALDVFTESKAHVMQQ